jgi:hypothetical protein
MVTVVTICSANFLARAKTLGHSVLEHNPGYRFVIGLVDRIPTSLSPAYWKPYELIPVEELAIPEFDEMVRRYNIVELNTAVKPFYIEELYRRHQDADQVIYLDPDILVLSGLEQVESALSKSNLVVTPHSCTYDNSPENIWYEISMLQTGLFNLGFLGTKRGEITVTFLKWWQRRLLEYCRYWTTRGLFVDQHWVNLAPVYFQDVHIEKDPGLNMAYWNLFERTLSSRAARYWVNEKHPLVFYHFSSYDPNRPDFVANRQPPLLLRDYPHLEPLFSDYRRRLLQRDHEVVATLSCALYPPSEPAPEPEEQFAVKRHMKNHARSVLHALPTPIQRGFKRLGEFLADNALSGG